MASDEGRLLQVHFGSNVPQFVEGDEGRLLQVLLNIISNAIKYNKYGGKVDVICTLKNVEKDHYVILFEVADTGIGIREGDIEKLFKPFTQLHGPTFAVKSSTGLGLVVSKGLVELMGGKIWVKSMKGIGTKFYFTVKLYKTTKAPIKKKPIAYNLEFAKNYPLKILVAEDNAINQRVIANILGNFGYSNAEIVDNGKKVLDKLKSSFYDVILMDVHMPEMDGLEATRRIRGIHEKQPKILAVTASTMKDEIDNFLKAGMDGVLQKPISEEELINALREVSTSIKEKSVPS